MTRTRTPQPNPTRKHIIPLTAYAAVPRPHLVKIKLVCDSRFGTTRSLVLHQGYCTETLLRFSNAARRQILYDGQNTFEIHTKHRGEHPAMLDNASTILDFLAEMMHLPVGKTRFAKPPVMFAHFAFALVHALLFLEMLNEFDFVEGVMQVDWVSKWITNWLSSYDILPQEVSVAWQVLRHNAESQDLLDLVIFSAVKTWDIDSLYFMKGHEGWIRESQRMDDELWARVAKEMDVDMGEGYFGALWSSATDKANLRTPTWFVVKRTSEYSTEDQKHSAWCKNERERLFGNRRMHASIIQRVCGDGPIPLSEKDQARANMADGTWKIERSYNARGEVIKRFTKIDPADTTPQHRGKKGT